MDSEMGRVDEHHNPKRAEDFSFVARVGSLFLKYNWLVSMIVWFFIALGFDFKMPKDTIAEIRQEIQANRAYYNARADSLEQRMADAERERSRMLEILEGLAIDACDRLKGDRYARARLRCDNGR